MSFAQKLAVTAAYVLVLTGIGTADAYLTHDRISLPPAAQDEINDITPDDVVDDTTPDPTTGVVKQDGPNIQAILQKLNIVTQETHEQSLLRRIIPETVPVTTTVLLRGNDRIAFFSSVESPDVKSYFTALKEALHASFSGSVQDLIDEVQEDPSKPARAVLSFLDPAIHEDRLLFVRSRARLYEFHIAPGREGDVNQVLDELTD